MNGLANVREVAGLVWGKATTLALAIGVAVMAVPLPANIAVPDWIRWGLFGVALVVAALRQVAPPPPAVTIRTGDSVAVNHAAGTVTIAKEEPLPAGMRSKVAGESSREPPPPQS